MSNPSIPGYTGPFNPVTPVPSGQSRIVIYNYIPSLAFAIVAIVTFSIATAYHGWLCIRKTHFRLFQLLLVCGCIMEVVGYAFRAASSQNPFVIVSFILQYFLTVVAPVTFSAAIYIALSMAIKQCQDDVLPIDRRFMVPFFVSTDVSATVLQIIGSALVGVAESKQANGTKPPIAAKSANDILIAGLAIQSAFFLMFLVILGLTAIKNRHLKTAQSMSTASTKKEAQPEHDDRNLRRYIPSRLIKVLASTALLIWARTLYRLAETAEGVFGYAFSHEWTFGIFEFAPVLVAVWIWMIFPLHSLLQATGSGGTAGTVSSPKSFNR